MFWRESDEDFYFDVTLERLGELAMASEALQGDIKIKVLVAPSPEHQKYFNTKLFWTVLLFNVMTYMVTVKSGLFIQIKEGYGKDHVHMLEKKRAALVAVSISDH